MIKKRITLAKRTTMRRKAESYREGQNWLLKFQTGEAFHLTWNHAIVVAMRSLRAVDSGRVRGEGAGGGSDDWEKESAK